MDLQDYRNKIDEIDDALVSLLRQRLAVSRQIAAYKADGNVPVLDQRREQEILDRVAAVSGRDADAVRAVYAAILKASRDMQQLLLRENE